MQLQPANTAFLFPGQGSQQVGMGRELAEVFPVARDTFARGDELLGFHLTRLAWEGPESELNDTINTQPALFVHSMAVLDVFRELYPDFQPGLVAGHSMGELSALVAGGALGFSDGLRLVRMRGQLMKRAGEISPGGMAAILGLDIPTLERICAEASIQARGGGTEIVQVANDNCPGQVVISGARPALERALALAQAAGARRAIPLPISIAAHSPLMANSQEDFNQAVESTTINDPTIPIVGNVTAQRLTTTQQLRLDLQAQLTHRVRWAESVQLMIQQGITTFLELGTGSVLVGLLKRIDGQTQGIPLGTPTDFEKLNAV